MATIAEFRLPVDGFPLGRAIVDDPVAHVELERIVPAEEGILPFFWVWECADLERFERTVVETRAVRSLEVATRVEEGRLYRARWNADVEGFVRGISRAGGTILDGHGSADGWRVELRFVDHAHIRSFLQYCHDNDVPIELRRVYTAADANVGTHYGLTESQRETICAAYERGYFDEPRGVTQAELAAAFDVSQRAISRRIRRGLSRLVGSTIASSSNDR